MAKQIKVSPSSGQQELIDILAAAWGMSDATVVMEAFSKAAPQMMSELEQLQRLRGRPTVLPSDRAREFVKALAEKRKPDLLSLQQLADELEVPSEVLAELVAECCCDREKSHAKFKA